MTESLNYLLLGNLHVVSMSHWHGGLPPKTRMLLALLLTAGPEGVSTRRIVAGLWGDDFPLSAPQMIRTHVMRLRSMLGPHGAVHRTRADEGRGAGFPCRNTPKASLCEHIRFFRDSQG
ncbi:helix-turn-helix domain-containing protein [Streptomyces sp. NPDC002205]|uniref:AfsR/SARP family transcriptional regulator n=1 Tax=Streptomyces sp. NPDC002205 TaxID=3154411 RepID=UPI00332919B3